MKLDYIIKNDLHIFAVVGGMNLEFQEKDYYN
jgi:hypothetical protein